MNLDKLRQLPHESVRKLYKTYVKKQNVCESTVQTTLGDTFYLWKNVSGEEFWSVVMSEQFEIDAKEALQKALLINSSGNVSNLVGGYVAKLRKFREFVFSEDVYLEEQYSYKAIKEFLLDIDCLNQLSEWTSRFNMFDILKITRMEIRHSNILSWLLDPNENHGLGDRVIRGFIQDVASTYSEEKEIINTLMMDCHDFNIRREWRNIDILAISHGEKFVVCIENKIDSVEHSNQLERYKTCVEETYPEYKKIYIYLSPEGLEASDAQNWCAMSYQEVLDIVENARKHVQLLPDAELLINNYLDTLRRDIVGDERLAQICAEIYTKHKKALDLIFEYKPDKATDLAEIFRNWAIEKTENKEIQIDLNKCNKSYTRFTTEIMSSILSDTEEANSGWNTKNHYFCEIVNHQGDGFSMQVSLSSKNLTEEQREICDKINEKFPSKQQKENWQWRTPFTTKIKKVDEQLDKEKIYKHLDEKFEELKEFEKQLQEYFQG